MTSHERYQRRQIRDGVWRPVIAAVFCLIWLSMLISSVCDALGVK